jgi:hypothetical protein
MKHGAIAALVLASSPAVAEEPSWHFCIGIIGETLSVYTWPFEYDGPGVYMMRQYTSHLEREYPGERVDGVTCRSLQTREEAHATLEQRHMLRGRRGPTRMYLFSNWRGPLKPGRHLEVS